MRRGLAQGPVENLGRQRIAGLAEGADHRRDLLAVHRLADLETPAGDHALVVGTHQARVVADQRAGLAVRVLGLEGAKVAAQFEIGLQVAVVAAQAADPAVGLELKLTDPDGRPLEGSGERGRLWVRRPRAGDRLQPLGMRGRKKLSDLLVDGSFDLGFPWFRPTCELMAKLEELSPDDAWLCKNYNFSEPFYEFVYGFFTPKGAYTVARTTFLDFSDARICRPAGPSIMDLKINGLDGEEVTFVRPETLAECFALLQAGEVDAVSGEAFEAENLLAELGLFDEVEELPNLGLLQTVHAIAHNARPGADDALATMNKGLIELKVSGEWFRIVGRHLAKN